MSSLNLKRSQISGDALQRIGTLTNLRKLNLDGLVVADSSQLTLPELSNVRWLQACSDSITDELLEQLNSPLLEFLSVGPHVTETGLQKLSKLEQLRAIAVYGSSLYSHLTAALASLAQINQIVVLDRILAKDQHGAMNLAKWSAVPQEINSKLSEAINELRMLSPKVAIIHL